MHPIQIAIAALAAVTVVVTLAYRADSRRKTASYYADQLTSPDPAARATACVEWTEYGLARSAPSLLRHVKREKDPYVLATLADAVRSRAWEPQSTPEVAALREFAARFHLPTSSATEGEQP